MKKHCKFSEQELLLYSMLNIITAFLSVSIAMIIEKTIDAVGRNSPDDLKKIMIFTVVFLCMYFVFSYLRNVFMQKMLDNYIKKLRDLLFEKVMGQSYGNFREKSVSEYLSVLTNDIQSYQEGGVKSRLVLMQNAIMLVIVFLTLLFTNVPITILIVICTIGIYKIPHMLQNKIVSTQNQVAEGLENITKFGEEHLEGFYVIHTYMHRKQTCNAFAKTNENYNEKKISLDKVLSKSEVLSATLSVATELLILFVSAGLVFSKQLSVGSMVAVMQLTGAFVQPLMTMMQNIPRISAGKALEQRFLAMLEKETEEIHGKEQEALSFQQAIQFENISFSYGKKQPVLSHLNCVFEKGKKYAIVGGSGAGKTTLINLLNGIYYPKSGEIYVDGHRVTQQDYGNYLELFSTAGQQAFLFQTDIENNITMGKETDAAMLQHACEVSGVQDFLQNLPKGVKTEIQEHGGNLSGGQRQRIEIARAVYHRKPVMILDEGVSAIDKKTAYEIEKNLLDMPEQTVIVITHDVKSPLLRMYDKILFLRQGNIEAVGNYGELCGKYEEFRRFVGMG